MDEKFIMRTMAVNIITTDVPLNRDTFMRDAAHQIALELIANGCLSHSTGYDYYNNKKYESISIVVGQKEKKLP